MIKGNSNQFILEKNLMLRNSTILILVLFVASVNGYAQKTDGKAEDEAMIRANVKQMETGWNAHDGKAFAAPFAADADYIVINGMLLKGREAIGQAHQRIFDTIFKDTKLKIEIRQIRFLRSDVAIIHTKANVVKKDDAFPAVAGAFPSLVLSKDGGKWQIVAFQNTANAEIEANRK